MEDTAGFKSESDPILRIARKVVSQPNFGHFWILAALRCPRELYVIELPQSS